ncbi:glycoside hydrolase family 28 protein [Zunongwangia sp. HGR-M22]|uniref:glycoside hydrolase family 28 protein n=1 Tax=Zunongwangia sp. HGR-M22 TaxID=3015168 RepID=UPI0022DE389E|nr:glycoside hydrolase family 28 protein [Zunongwangia sp. HGR-M22]WBL24661.1 glycoside hydrolase family 28 protein [Zunongwangia sp. HGR-M22]
MFKNVQLVICLLLPMVSFAQADWINIAEKRKNVQDSVITDVIQSAINEASEKGGGTVYFPAGDYLTGALRMKSNITLHLDAGAMLRFSDDFNDYLPFVEMRWEGTVMKNFSPLIYAYEVENIAITGRGTIDGQGRKWWLELYRIETAEEKPPRTKFQKMWVEQNKGLETSDYYQRTMSWEFFRPPLFQAYRSNNILIEGVTIQNSPFWTVNPAFCNNIKITGVTIFNPESPNTDGINPTSCRNVHISDSHISVGDDCITIKSGRDADGRKWATPTENVTITNCTMLSGHGGVVIGSEMSGGIKKITISNCVFDGTDRGIRLKTARGRGGVVEDIRVSNIVMNNIQQQAIMMNMFYDHNETIEPVTERTPTFRNIHFSGITGKNIKNAGRIAGIEEMPVENISFSDIDFEAEEGFYISVAKNVEFHDVSVTTKKGPSFEILNSQNIVLDNVETEEPLENTPVIKIENINNLLLTNTAMFQPMNYFLSVSGEETKNIYLQNTILPNAKTIVKKGSKVSENSILQTQK